MRILTWSVPALLFGAQIWASAATIPPGTQIAVRSDQPIDVHIWDRGRIYPAHVTGNVYSPHGDLVIPAGSSAELIVRETGPNQMALDLESIAVNGARYALDTQGPNFNVPPVQTQGNGIVVPPSSVLTFQLEQPLHVVSWNDPGYLR